VSFEPGFKRGCWRDELGRPVAYFRAAAGLDSDVWGGPKQ